MYTDTVTIPGGDYGDFTPILHNKPHTITFSGSSDTVETINIEVDDDNWCEPTESFLVYLDNPNGGILGSQWCSNVSISDDDCKL